jgi:hypothetical protein
VAFLQSNISFSYNGNPVEIVCKFTYLGIVFTTGGSFSEAQSTLAGIDRPQRQFLECISIYLNLQIYLLNIS